MRDLSDLKHLMDLRHLIDLRPLMDLRHPRDLRDLIRHLSCIVERGSPKYCTRGRVSCLSGDHVMESDSLFGTALQAALLIATLVATCKLVIDVVGWP